LSDCRALIAQHFESAIPSSENQGLRRIRDAAGRNLRA
jgi:hypothetical protein